MSVEQEQAIATPC